MRKFIDALTYSIAHGLPVPSIEGRVRVSTRSQKMFLAQLADFKSIGFDLTNVSKEAEYWQAELLHPHIAEEWRQAVLAARAGATSEETSPHARSEMAKPSSSGCLMRLGTVRTTVFSGRTLYLAADVCRQAGISSVTLAMRGIHDTRKGRIPVGLPGSPPWFLTADGLRQLMAAYPQAKFTELSRALDLVLMPKLISGQPCNNRGSKVMPTALEPFKLSSQSDGVSSLVAQE